MPHDSSHGANCGCDPSEHQLVEGVADFLFGRIDRDRIVVLNGADGIRGEGKSVVKAWEERGQEDQWLESDADEQLIVQIPFTGSIKLRSIIIKAGPAGYTPDKVMIFSNAALDFDQATSQTPTQSLDIAVSREAIEYPLRPSKFPSTQSVTLFFPSSHGEDTSRIFFIGFKGEYSILTRDPVITVYESMANPADHPKIQGMGETNHSSIG